jgi:hypothetical protein
MFFLSVSCSKVEDVMLSTTGFLSIDVHVNMIIREEGAKTNSSNTADFIVGVFTANHVEVATYKVSELPPLVELPVGEYYIAVHSNNLVPASFERPFYTGQSENFIIAMEESKQVSVVCSLANCMLSIDYSSSVKDKFFNYSSEVTYPGGSLAFSQDETRIAYFDLLPLSIVSCLEYLDGEKTMVKTVTGQIASPKAKTHYKIIIDANLNNGQIGLGVSVDEQVETIELRFGDAQVVPPPTTIGMNEVEYGNLLITEIMFDPQVLTDAQGEWVEIYNTTNKRINLNGLRFFDNTTNFTINQDLFINPNGYFIIAKHVNALENPDFITNTLNLANNGELLKLIGPTSIEIAIVDYGLIIGHMSTPPGSSLNLSRNKYTADDAQLPQNWCISTAVYSTGDKGTPGTENKICQ